MNQEAKSRVVAVSNRCAAAGLHRIAKVLLLWYEGGVASKEWVDRAEKAAVEAESLPVTFSNPPVN